MPSLYDLNDYSTNFSNRKINMDSIPEFAKNLWGMESNVDYSNAVAPVKTVSTPVSNIISPLPSYIPNANSTMQRAYMNSLPTISMDDINAGIIQRDDGTYYSNNPAVNFMLHTESKGKADAYNPTGATGLFQITDNTYNGLIQQHPELTGLGRYKAEDNYKLYKQLSADNIAMLKNAGIPINTFTVYGMHQQGPQFIRIYKSLIGEDYKGPINESYMANNMPKGKYIKGDYSSWANYWLDEINKFNK